MKKYTYPLAVLALFTALCLFFPSYYAQSEALQKAALQTRDFFFKVRHLSAPTPEEIKNIVIITIDDESCQKLGARWPWSRKVFAAMVDELKKRGAKVIGLNVSFTGVEGEDDSATDALAQVLRNHGSVVIGATFDSENHLIKPNAKITDAVARIGYLEKIVDTDYSIRRSYLLRPYSLEKISSYSFESSFPLQLVAVYSGSLEANAPRFDRDLGLLTAGVPRRAILVNADGSYAINYLVAESDFIKIPAWKVVEGRLANEDVRGKVALVGLTSSLFSDRHPTPFGLMSGISIHANEFLSIIIGRQLHFVPDKITFFVAWLSGLLIVILFLLRRFLLGFVGMLVIFFGLFLGAQFFFNRDFVVDAFNLILGPLFGMLTGVTANSLKLLLENKGLETKVIQDKLTGLYTYEFLRARLDEEWRRCQKAKTPVSVVMTDLDRFKKINDTLGHEVGNEMIRRAAAVIKESVRGYDVISRYGGDEFVILLWHASLGEAKAYRGRLRNLYHAMAKTLAPELQGSSISIGVATFDPNDSGPVQPKDPQALVEEADKDLFLDKKSRRGSDSR